VCNGEAQPVNRAKIAKAFPQIFDFNVEHRSPAGNRMTLVTKLHGYIVTWFFAAAFLTLARLILQHFFQLSRVFQLVATQPYYKDSNCSPPTMIRREAYEVRPACRRFREEVMHICPTAPASRTHSIRFAQFGCGLAAPCKFVTKKLCNYAT